MSKRVLVSSLLAVVAVGGITAGGVAMASAATEPTLTNGSAHYVPPTGTHAGTFTYTADVSDDSGIRALNVVAWPASSEPAPIEGDLRYVDAATCVHTSDETARCTYTFKVTEKEAAEAPKGTWNVTALLTAEDGNTLYVPDAGTFEMRP